MKNCIALALSVFLVIINPSISFASFGAQNRAELRGTVTDEAGGLMPAVSVTLENPGGEKITTQTDELGRYRFANLAPGPYTMKIELESFAPFSQQVDLSNNQTATVDASLKVFISEEIEVNDEEAGISAEPESNLSAIVLTETDLEALPDDPDELLETLRAMAGATGGNDEASVYVDGFRESGDIPPKEAILRVRLNTNPFSAEFNEPGHSRIEIITKPGSDAFHGGFRFNFNDESLNARNAFAPSRAPLQTRNYSGHLSGPIIGNRWGFFLSLDRREQDENEVVNATILNPATLEPDVFVDTVLTPTRSTGFSLRTDYLLNPKNTLGVRYRYSKREQLNEGLSGGFDLPERAYNRSSSNSSLRVYLTTIASERAVNEFRLQLSRRASQTRAITDAPALIVLDAFSSGGNQSSLFADNTSREVELSNNLTYTYGKHAFKFGLRAEGESNEILNQANFGGTFTFGTDVERDSAGIPVLDAGGNQIPISALELYRRVLAGEPGYRPSQFLIARGDPFVSVRQWEMGWFAQDDWRISKRMTLSYGLRHEFQTNLEDKLNLAPRFGIAWQPDGKGKSTLRFGAGIFYDYIDDGITLDALRLDGFRQQQFVIQQPGFFPGIPDLLEGAVRRQPTIRVKGEHLNSPYSIISTASYERLLPANIFASAGYTWTRGVHLLRTRNVNAPLFVGEEQIPVKPLSDEGPVLEFESTGLSTRHEFWVGFRTNISRVNLFGRYTLSSTHSNTDSAYQTPANSYDLGPEWGRSSRDARHQLFIGGSISLPWDLRVAPYINANSGRPFNITTGRDNNQDTLFSDRPAFASPGDPDAVVTRFGVFNPNPQPGDQIIPRNFGQGPGSVSVNLNISKTFGFGPQRGFSARGAVNQQVQQARINRRLSRMGRGGRGRGGRGGGGDSRQKYSLTLSLNTRNLFNTVNLAGFNGVLTSPFFGTANRAQASRRIEASLSFRF